MSTVWTTGWEALPANLSSPSLGPAYIRGLKTAIHERMWNEHGTYSNANSGADGSPSKDWVHKAGSAAAYFVTTTPTKRPDASTAFTTSDTGRLWVNSTSRTVKALSGTTFVPVSGHEYHKFQNTKTFVSSLGGINIGTQLAIFKYFSFSKCPQLSQALFFKTGCIIQSDAGGGWFKYPLDLTLFHISGPTVDYVYARRRAADIQFITATLDAKGTSPLKTRFTNTGINRGWVVIEYV